jgi:hypothetical protein
MSCAVSLRGSLAQEFYILRQESPEQVDAFWAGLKLDADIVTIPSADNASIIIGRRSDRGRHLPDW